MAAVVGSVTILGASVAVSSASRRSGAVRFAEVSGLKVQTFRSSTALTYSNRITRQRGARIVCEAQNAAVEVAAVTESTWKSLVLESASPVLVEFWAPWCGPCRMIHPVVDKVAKDYAGKLKCYKVNTDENPSIATQYGVRSIPTVIVFKDGEKKEAVIGAVPESTLTTCVDKFL